MSTPNLEAELTAEIPKLAEQVKWFLSLKQQKLAELTNTDSARWTRVLQGGHLGEMTLNRYAQMLGMKPHIFLFALHLRRESYQARPLGKVEKLAL